jgi:hypothetical protein
MADDTRESHPSCASPWYAGAALIVVLCWFCGPLFIELGEWDLQSDEAIVVFVVVPIRQTAYRW